MKKVATQYMHVGILTLAMFGSMASVAYAQDVTLVSILDALSTSLGAFVAVGVALALALFIWGLVTAIYQTKNDADVAKSRSKMLWGLLALTILVSMWGAVRILQGIVGVEDAETECRSPMIGSDMSIENCF
jgi:hypothetical protein